MSSPHFFRTAILEKGAKLNKFTLGDGSTYGGCKNHPLSTSGSQFATGEDALMSQFLVYKKKEMTMNKNIP